LDTDTLVDAARRGDAPAYLALVRPLHAEAVRLATVITGSRADADDVVQEALVKAHAAMGRFRPGSPFRPWLLRVVATEAKNRRRATHRRAAATERYARVAALGDGIEAPDPEALARDLGDLAERLRAADVPPDVRATLRDRLGVLAARCQWVKNEQQRAALDERVEGLWKAVGNNA
jgi:RNA polymerase sigma-70 factor (ECF subfamily)